jgi:hypothetical protein
VSAAGDEPLEERRFCRLCIEMEGLGVELRGEGLDLRFVECVRAGHELLADVTKSKALPPKSAVYGLAPGRGWLSTEA